ncbi:hypothetical protein ABZ119_30150 [Streptomyces sp. NPDC006288]|uniref:hypothetical protein n=1 Tax=Streptomyces sp. NPDC006288 TaxID=3156743 RepID=UPI0033AB9C85
MDPYDSQPGRDRPVESSTPIYDRLLAEWHAAATRETGRGPAGETPGWRSPVGPGPRRGAAFVPAARAEGERGGR